MNKKFVEYFQDLNRTRLPRKNGRILCDDKTVIFDGVSPTRSNIEFYTIGKRHYFGKKWITNVSPTSIVAHQMYNDLGINAPPAFVLDTGVEDETNNLRTITPDVTQLANPICTHAINFRYLTHTPEFRCASNKWDILYNEAFRQKLLSYMTNDCLNQLIKMFLVDEVRSEKDRHMGNYFLARNSGEHKYSHVIAIDFDDTAIMAHQPRSKIAFEEFLYYPNTTFTPSESNVPMYYADRISELKEIIGEGSLTTDQFNTVKNALEYDYAKAIKNFCINQRLFKEAKSAPEPIDRLWDYNRKELGRELGL